MSDGAQRVDPQGVNGGSNGHRPPLTPDAFMQGLAKALIAVGAGWNIPCKVVREHKNDDGDVTNVEDFWITPAQLIWNLTESINTLTPWIEENIDAVDENNEIARQSLEQYEDRPKKRRPRK